MSTSAAGASSEPPKRTYAEPGAKKRSVKVRGPPAKQAQGKGKGKAVIEEDEADENDENEAAEAPPKKKAKARLGGIELLLAKKFDLETKKQDPTGWWISEKRASAILPSLPCLRSSLLVSAAVPRVQVVDARKEREC